MSEPTEKKFAFHFSLGNSSTGPIGYCAVIYGNSVKEAVETLQKVVPNEQKVHVCDDDERENVDYIEAYFNEQAITEKDIDFFEETEDGSEHNRDCAVLEGKPCNCATEEEGKP